MYNNSSATLNHIDAIGALIKKTSAETFDIIALVDQ